MSNETVVRLTGDASGYISELERARKSAADFVTSQEAVRQRLTNSVAAIESTRNALKAQGDEAVAAFNKTARTAEGWLTSLQKQAGQAGKTRAELMELRAAELGVADAAQPFIDKIKAAEEAMNSGGHAAHGFNLATAGARRELLVLAHEASQGSWKNFGGSLLVLGERTDALSALMNKTALSIGAFVGVIAVAALQVYHARDALAEYGEKIEALHQKTGISTDAIQQWSFATKTVGVDTKDATKALADLGDAQNKAVNGNKDAAKAFAAVGLSLADLKKSSPEQLLPQIADAFAHSADSASKAAVANELFGSSGAELIPLLDKGKAGLDALRAAAQESGAVIGGDTVAKMAALKDQMELSKAKMDALTLSAKTQLLPTILNLTDAMTGNVAMKPLMVDFYNAIGFIVKSTASAVATLVVGFQQTSEVIATLVSVTSLAMSGDFRLAVNAAQVGYDNLKKQGDGYAQFMKRLWSDVAPPAAPAHGASGPALQFAKGGAAAARGNDNAVNAELAELQNQQKIIEDALRASLEHIKALRAEGVMSEVDALAQSYAAEQDALQKRIDIDKQQEEIAKGKKNTEAYRRYAADIERLQQQMVSNYNKFADDIRLASVKEARAVQVYTDSLNEQLKTQQAAADMKFAGLSMGASAKAQYDAEIKIMEDYDKKRAALAKSLSENKIGKSQYDAQLKATQDYYDSALAIARRSSADILAANEDWTTGASRAIQNYADSASNIAAQVDTSFTNMAKSMEDAIANFVTTGKLNFASLANSIIADIVRMQARAAMSGLFSSLAGLIGTGVAGSFGTLASTGSAASAASDVMGAGYSSGLMGPSSMMPTYASLPARASGGPVADGTAYMVGERGPEMFVPNQSGSIVPNHALGGNGGGVSVQIVNNSNAEVQQPQVSQDSSGRRFIRLIIDQAKSEIAGEMAGGQGSVSKALTQRYGLTPRFR